MVDASLFGEGEVGQAPTLTVGELSTRIARLTATAFPGDLWVAGQIRNLTRSANGHAYFELAEPTAAGETPRAQLSVALLAPERKHVNDQLLRAGGAVRMEDGIEVRILGRLRWYTPRGTMQLRMHGIDPAFTLGRLQVDRDRILAALVADGLLGANGSRPLPLVPLRIGLLTSRGSAAHADVLAELAGSGIAFTVREVDARTQGADCAASVVRGLRRLAADRVDLVLLVRGGGARTDLAGFDTDLIARAIATLAVPVFTGIGHEVDRSVADEVAHAAHKTPTAAAGAVVARVRAFLDRIDERWTAARQAALVSTSAADGRLVRRSGRVERAASRALARQASKLDVCATRTGRVAVRTLDRAETALGTTLTTGTGRARRGLDRAGRSVDGLQARIAAHDPGRALSRGWTITTTTDGRAVRTVADLRPGTDLLTRFADGVATSTVSGTVASSGPAASTPADPATDIPPSDARASHEPRPEEPAP